VLATDLDGTFAAGRPETRAALAAAIAAAPVARLIYVTGRGPESTRRLIDKLGLPEPELLVSDVGSSVFRNGKRIADVESALAERWPGADSVRERLLGTKGIAEQDVRAPHRVSYAVSDPDDLRLAVRRVKDRLRRHEVDVHDSDGRYLDVLPRGVNKGTTLMRVLAHMWMPHDGTVVAGDSMNDLSLFDTGLRGVLVANAEPRLVRKVAKRGHVHTSEHDGVDAIVEGLIRFGFLVED
jgi:HAD superfamily hydrolase (TIGR01484 family)